MSEKIYTCIDCGKELEQSHPFTYCDACWEGHYPTHTSSAGIDEQLDEVLDDFRADVQQVHSLANNTLEAQRAYFRNVTKIARQAILDLFEREGERREAVARYDSSVATETSLLDELEELGRNEFELQDWIEAKRKRLRSKS